MVLSWPTYKYSWLDLSDCFASAWFIIMTGLWFTIMTEFTLICISGCLEKETISYVIGLQHCAVLCYVSLSIMKTSMGLTSEDPRQQWILLAVAFSVRTWKWISKRYTCFTDLCANHVTCVISENLILLLYILHMRLSFTSQMHGKLVSILLLPISVSLYEIRINIMHNKIISVELSSVNKTYGAENCWPFSIYKSPTAQWWIWQYHTKALTNMYCDISQIFGLDASLSLRGIASLIDPLMIWMSK